ncbi:hypothetical protein PsorP6_018880 [Peronosclerospora sorghi]|nr:hypothetical protein PsorP6_018880 [Peronosclerospora sorghi]
MVAEALLTVLILLKVQKKLKNARHSAISGRQDYRPRFSIYECYLCGVAEDTQRLYAASTYMHETLCEKLRRGP